MRISYGGFTWTARLPAPGQKAPSRAEAEAALAAVPANGRACRAYREACAAFACADFLHAVDQAAFAREHAEEMDYDACGER